MLKFNVLKNHVLEIIKSQVGSLLIVIKITSSYQSSLSSESWNNWLLVLGLQRENKRDDERAEFSTATD